MNITYYIGFALLLFVVLSLLFRRCFSALFLDYVVDCGLSFLDEFFGGLGMFDWGDWIAAIIIFRKRDFL